MLRACDAAALANAAAALAAAAAAAFHSRLGFFFRPYKNPWVAGDLNHSSLYR